MFLTFLRNVAYDFFTSFKYNNMKLAGILVAVPGIFIGFFLGVHSNLIRITEYKSSATSYYMNFSFDYSGLALFILMLFGILNIFTGVQMMGKKNLGSVVVSTLCTTVIIVCGALYIYALYVFIKGTGEFKEAVNAIMKAQGLTFAQAKDQVKNVGISIDELTLLSIKDSDIIISIGSIVVSMVAPLIGCILGFIKYDRTYEKVNR